MCVFLTRHKELLAMFKASTVRRLERGTEANEGPEESGLL